MTHLEREREYTHSMMGNANYKATKQQRTEKN